MEWTLGARSPERDLNMITESNERSRDRFYGGGGNMKGHVRPGGWPVC